LVLVLKKGIDYITAVSCPLECNKAIIFVRSCSIWVLLLSLVGLPLVCY